MFFKDRANLRAILKSITWRLIASLTTFVLALFFFRDDPMAAQKATGVAITEVFIKMLFYYMHERLWYNIRLGRHKADEGE